MCRYFVHDEVCEQPYVCIQVGKTICKSCHLTGPDDRRRAMHVFQQQDVRLALAGVAKGSCVLRLRRVYHLVAYSKAFVWSQDSDLHWVVYEKPHVERDR